MTRKNLTLGLAVVSMAVLPTMASASCFQSGGYAGAHVGVTHGRGKFNTTFDTTEVFFGAGHGKKKAKKTAPLVGLIGGYRHVFCEGYTVGVSLTGDLYGPNDMKASLEQAFPDQDPFPAFRDKISRRASIIPALTVGAVICDRWHVGLGLGVAITRFRHHVTAPSLLSSNKVKTTSTKVGFVPSVSGEYAMSQCTSLTANVSYEMYKKLNKTFGDEISAPRFRGSSFASSIRPRYLTAKLGALYRF